MLLNEGDFLKVIGFKVKNDNDIFVVKHKYEHGEYCLYKVTTTGEESKVKYNIVFLKEKHFNDPSLTIEVITKDQLKQAKNEVNEYLKGITQETKVYSFNEIEGREINKGDYFKVIKSIPLTSSIYNVCTNAKYVCDQKNDRGYVFHRLGKRGEPLSTYNANGTNKVLLHFTQKLVNQLFDESYIVMVERIEQTKGEIEQNEKETIQEEQQEQTGEETILNYQYTITPDTDTRDNSDIWIVKVTDKLSKEEYIKVSNELKKVEGHYSRFKKGFLFKYDPSEVLKGNGNNTEETEQKECQEKIEENKNQIAECIDKSMEQEEQQEENPYKQPDIEDNFMYDAHFKAWDIDIKNIQEQITALNIDWIDWGEKIGFKGLTADQVRQAKEISDNNGSIFFIDEKKLIEVEEPEQEKKIFIQGIAYEYGVNAFYNGLKCVPAHDEKFLNDIITGLQVGESVKWLEDWIHGWTDANLEKARPDNKEEEIEEDKIMSDDILSKFDNIKVDNDTRISEEDQGFCQEQERMYNECFDMFLEFYNRSKEWYANNKQSEYNKYMESSNSYHNSYGTLEDAVFKINENFINCIVRYFENNYNITIDINKIKNKTIQDVKKDYYDRDTYRNALKKTNYNDILDQIFIQLDGFSFKDKSVKELKDKMREKIGGSRYVDINKNKLTINNFIYPHYSWDGKECYIHTYSGETFYVFMCALTHFEIDQTKNMFTGLCHKLGSYINKSDFFTTHSIDSNKIESIRLYKNGKIDVKFKSFEHAEKFAKEYCGYIGKDRKSA